MLFTCHKMYSFFNDSSFLMNNQAAACLFWIWLLQLRDADLILPKINLNFMWISQMSKCWLENCKKHNISMGKCSLSWHYARAYCHKRLSLDREEARREVMSLSATLTRDRIFLESIAWRVFSRWVSTCPGRYKVLSLIF